MLLLEQVGVKEQLPGLILCPSGGQRIYLELIPILLEGGEPDCAGRGDANLDDLRPPQVLEFRSYFLISTTY